MDAIYNFVNQHFAYFAIAFLLMLWAALGLFFGRHIAVWFPFLLTSRIYLPIPWRRLAYLLTSGIRGQNFLRAGFFTPNLIGGIVLGYIWQFIFSRVIVNLNDFMNLPLFEKSWLSSPGGAFAAMVIVTTWQYSGYMLLIYISGFVSVSQDLLEAARIDGGNSNQVTRYITIPMMMPSFVTCLFLSLTRCFKVYDLNLALTGGGPYDSTKMAAMHIYTQAFENHKYGVGQAEALVLFLVMGIIAFIQIKTGKAKEVEA